MPNTITYEQLQQAIPELKHKHYEAVIVGYTNCPYSIKSQQSLQKHISKSNRFKDKSIFVGFDWGETDQLKKQTGYSGTFPIVFVKNTKTGKMEHIGGGNEMVAFVEQDLLNRVNNL